MKKKILIIRSVSFQQLDKNVKEIVKRFPGYEFHLLTHAHGIDAARGYGSISEVIDWGSRKNFSMFHVPAALRTKNQVPYDFIIVPVTNMTGAGFLNVLSMSFRIPSRSVYMCNLVSDLWEIPKKKILFLAFKHSFFASISVILTVPLVASILPVLFLTFICRRLSRRFRLKGAPG